MPRLFYYDRDCYSAIAIVLFPLIAPFSCEFDPDSCAAVARCIAFVIVLSRLLFGDCFCYIAITVSLSRCLDGGFSIATAIAVLWLHFCIAIVIVSCCIAIAI